jgi:16S rRNA (cytosine967-C5)-methyltransferase
VLQADILDSAQRLVKPGGRLIYATCSLLMEEDEDQIAKFLETHPDFFLVPIRDIWADTVGGECPARNDTLRLTPSRHGTDGFFVAVMERKPVPKKEESTDAKDAGEAAGADAEDESTDG